VRYPPGHRQKSRARILQAAASLFRGRGISATGIDRVMRQAGLTAGGFYAHFRSKDELVAETVATAAQAARDRWYGRFDELRGRAWAAALVSTYLSAAHRDDRAGGCILPSLGGEIPQSGRPARLRFEARLRGMFDLFALRSQGELPVERADYVAALALCVGGLLLSRAVVSPALSLEILGASRTRAERLLGLDRPSPARRPTRERTRRSRKVPRKSPRKST
jgi:TetR/AcrR family transcriptional repressor of nem operon